MGIIKIDFSRIAGTSRDIKPILPLWADRGVEFYELDTKDIYVWNGVEWELQSRNWSSYIRSWIELDDTPSEYVAGKLPIVNAEGTGITFIDYPGGGGAGTGLEAINEGNGIGWRLIGRDPANYGNIGLGAIDFSTSTGASTTRGALGAYSFTQGRNNSGLKTFDTVFGDNNTIGASSSGYSTIFGDYNTIVSAASSVQNFVAGYNNSVGGFQSYVFGDSNNIVASTNGTGIGITVGAKNYVKGYITSIFGAGHSVTGSYTTAVGLASNVISDNDQGNTTVNRTLFVVGNGSVDANRNVLSRSNAFAVTYGGLVTAPSLSTAEIDAEGTGKVLTTKEWIVAQGYSTGGGLSSPLTTKGDIWGYTTTNAKLGVGTDTQILSADSTEPTGLKWIDAPTGGTQSLQDILIGTSGTLNTAYNLYAQSLDTNSTFQVDLSASPFYNSYLQGAGTQSTQINYYSSSIVIRNISSANRYSSININSNGLELSQSDVGQNFFTDVQFAEPTAQTTINFPAKGTGTYTLATLADVTGGAAPYLATAVAVSNVNPNYSSYIITSATAVDFSIVEDATTDYPINTVLRIVNMGLGAVSIVDTGVVTLNGVVTAVLAQYEIRTITKIAANNWLVGY